MKTITYRTHKDKLTEFEVHAEAYIKLKSHFKNVRGEYRYKPKPEARGARFDLVILDDNENISVVIEVKRTYGRKNGLKQVTSYKKVIDCPVVVLRGMYDINRCVDIVEKALINHLKQKLMK